MFGYGTEWKSTTMQEAEQAVDTSTREEEKSESKQYRGERVAEEAYKLRRKPCVAAGACQGVCSVRWMNKPAAGAG